MIYGFLLLERSGAPLHRAFWNCQHEYDDPDVRRLYGVLFELKRLMARVSPTGVPSDFYMYTTDKYKLHCYETLSGFRFILISDPRSAPLRAALTALHAGPFLDVVRSPLYEEHKPLSEFPRFARAVEDAVRALNK